MQDTEIYEEFIEGKLSADSGKNLWHVLHLIMN
jgi:hypothetical protein